MDLTGLVWFIITLGPLLILQRRLHYEIQSIFLLISRRSDVATLLFSLVFFPGVLLHEGSHFLMAKLLGVRTGRFSVFPRPMPGGRLQLGYVETASSDWLRETLIGVAPLLTGGLFVAYAGLSGLGIQPLWDSLFTGGWQAVLSQLPMISSQPDFGLWLYLTLVVSSTMLPSASDRRSWLPLAVMIALLFGISLLAGAGPWMTDTLAPLLNQALIASAAVLGISDMVHLLLLPPAYLLRRLVSRLTGLEVVI